MFPRFLFITQQISIVFQEVGIGNCSRFYLHPEKSGCSRISERWQEGENETLEISARKSRRKCAHSPPRTTVRTPCIALAFQEKFHFLLGIIISEKRVLFVKDRFHARRSIFHRINQIEIDKVGLEIAL